MRGTVSALELVEVTADLAPVLRNLFELYLHDFSETLNLHADERGQFLSDKEWQAMQERSHAELPRWLARVDGRWAGFAIVAHQSWLTGEADVHDVDEFFIMRAFRRRGHGSAMAREVIGRFPGRWEVRIRRENGDALQFWRKVIGEITRSGYGEREVDSTRWRGPVFSFTLPASDSSSGNEPS